MLKSKKIITITFIFVLSAMVISGCGEKSQETSTAPSESETTVTSTESQQAGIELIEQKVEKHEYGFWTTSFKVKNNTDSPINTLTLTVQELDNNGDIVNTTSPQEGTVIVKPGQSITMEGIHADDKGIKTVKVVGFDYVEGEDPESASFVQGRFNNTKELVLE